MSINIAAVKAEFAKCRKALVGPVTVLVTLALSGVLPGYITGPVLVVGSYLGIRQATNKVA